MSPDGAVDQPVYRELPGAPANAKLPELPCSLTWAASCRAFVGQDIRPRNDKPFATDLS